MALINVAAREIHGKIVYYGPGLCGKTTNLQFIHGKIPQNGRSDLLSIATETERTLFFDFLPLDLGKVHGFTIRFHLYTVPGQILYERTRVAVLNGADGVVFVADGQRDRLADNLQSLRELAHNLTNQGKRLLEFPLVMQYNKMDLPTALPTPVLDRYLNTIKVPRFEAVAVKGTGVFETLRAISKLVVNKL
ncbi:MAG TPA: ADP-ribosylation factor-like protein [Thermomicrobiales bacterium]|jgi:signal recognition particle receptor subunit beta|nr:ADP-ribosylation factor-like protein [Thermomicrobiales bacterium]